MNDYQRIEQVLKLLDMTARGLALAIGLKSPQIFYDIKAGKCGISKTLAETIQEHYLNISAAWLLTGEGSMTTGGVIQQNNQSGDNIQGNGVTVNKTDSEFIAMLKKKDAQIDKKNEQIDRLLSIIERMQS